MTTVRAMPEAAATHDAEESVSVPPRRALLSTKLQPPARRRDLVARPNLGASLRGRAHRLALVAAPAGWGKTTLLAEWLALEPRPVAWLSLDRGDNDAVQFWTYVVEALRRVVPDIGVQTTEWLRVPGNRAIDQAIPALLDELAAQERLAVLVLDDYQVILNRQIHEGLDFLLEHLPDTLQVVVASRSDPPFPLGRMRVRRDLVEVRADDLRFTYEDTVALVNDVLGLGLGRADVERVFRRTGGWVAGLHLVALSLRGHADPRSFIDAFAGDDRHVVDHLVTEVLGREPLDIRRFLLHTSVLERMSGSLCDATLGTDGSARMLERIERANLLLVPLDPHRTWYRYHEWFRELLRHELELTQPGVARELHRRAASWHRRQGSIAEAVEHALAAGDVEDVADLVSAHWAEFLQEGRLETVLGWLDALPATTVEQNPGLCLTRAWIAIDVGRLDELDLWIARANAAVGTEHEPDDDAAADAFRSAASMLRSIERYLSGHVGQAIESARSAQRLDQDETSPWRSVGCPVLGISLFWSGRSREASATLQDAIRRASLAGNHLAVMHAHGCLAVMHAAEGHLTEADRMAGMATSIGRRHGLSQHWTMALAELARGLVLERRGQLKEAEAVVEHALDLSERGVARVETAYSLLSLARLRRVRGDRRAARWLVERTREVVSRCPDPGILPRLLAGAEDQPQRPQATTGPTAPHAGPTGSERAVLAMLPGDLSQRDIARVLHLSLNTVKSHVRALYRKLDVSSRSAAVVRAGELGLLESGHGRRVTG